MKKFPYLVNCILSATLVALLSSQALAHSRWVVPSHTILSGEEPEVVTVDASISNDIFHPDYAFGGDSIKKVTALLRDEAHHPKMPPPNSRGAIIGTLMASTQVELTAPNGTVTTDTKLVDFGRKSTAALLLDQSGTYRVGITQNPIFFTSFKHSDGKPGRAFGQLDQVKQSLPEGVKDISVLKLINRVETYITRNELNSRALKPTGHALEVVFDGHPNELFVGEEVSGVLLLNGKPAQQGTELKLTRSGTRHRNDRASLFATVDEKGAFNVTIEQPGFYLMEVEFERPAKTKDADVEMYGLYVTLEVNPE